MAELLYKVTQLEYKRNNRFIVNYPHPFYLPMEVTHKASRPVYNALKDKWEDITFVLRDPIAPSTSKALLVGLTTMKQQKKEKKAKIKTHGPVHPELLTIELDMLDPTGKPVESWQIKGKIKKVDFGGLDYTDDGIATIVLIFKVKSATLVY